MNLFARLFETPEEYVACYLDMYFQLRLRWEEEKGRIATPACAQTSLECRTLPARQNAPTAKDEAADAEDDEAKAEAEPLKENRIKRQSGKGKPRPSYIGNTRSHDAAVFKRQVRERMLEMRKRGLTTPLIVKKGNANITEQQISDILAAKPVPVAEYRVLEAVLDMIEKDNILSAASAEG